MAFEKTCPICEFELGSPEEEKCPQCDADLTCFNVLNSIPDEPGPEGLRSSEERREKRISEKRLILGALSILFVGLIIGFFLVSLYKSDHPPLSVSYQQTLPVRIKIPDQAVSRWAAADEPLDRNAPALSQTMTEKKPEVPGAKPTGGNTDKETGMETLEREALQKEEEALQRRPADKKLTTVPAAERENFRIYEATDEDTLWRISKKQYGSGFYFPVIMECNPGIRVYDVQKGVRVKIFKDPGMAEKLYNENARIEGNRAYYHYLVLEDDTFESIALKFYKQGYMKNRIMDLNPHVKLRAGMRIKIELE
ncbi:MAG: LysM peptidoglycan-binding domain-containing protein [Deltaproteobacteria bacterium]|nr:LysM peptidoglycan-binding domain-containing protein [Deltaproteobacteria bacterium]